MNWAQHHKVLHIPLAILDFKCTGHMITPPARRHVAAKCCTLHATTTTLEFCSSCQLGVQIFYNFSFIIYLRCPFNALTVHTYDFGKRSNITHNFPSICKVQKMSSFLCGLSRITESTNTCFRRMLIYNCFWLNNIRRFTYFILPIAVGISNNFRTRASLENMIMTF